ncbi:immunoglobulin superfamily member 5-like isoform X3 [Narcine bancroftii]|uniref:immunoglobulin superfamily member 5-like isoform X3 n=1 Tax=Narcine bancroftii TaxID=1343680 RepID=UPI0038320B00
MVTVKRVLTLFSISLGVCLSTIIKEGPKNAFALLHSDASFNCTVSLPWNVIIWIMDTTPVLTIVKSGPIITNPQYGQRNYTTVNDFTSELLISSVTKENNMTVKCSIQTDGIQQAFLFVQVEGLLTFAQEISSVVANHPTDIVCQAEGWSPAPTIQWKINQTVVDSNMYTTTILPSSNSVSNMYSTLNLTLRANANVTCLAKIEALSQPKMTALFIKVKPSDEDRTWLIIAIVVPIAAVILIIILIILIIICIKRRKHSETYQNELRKMSIKKSLEMPTDDKAISGIENLGMSTGSLNDFRFSQSLTSPYWINPGGTNRYISKMKIHERLQMLDSRARNKEQPAGRIQQIGPRRLLSPPALHLALEQMDIKDNCVIHKRAGETKQVTRHP